MTFTYTRTTASMYSDVHDENFEESYRFDYEPERKEILDAIVSFLIDEAGGEEMTKEQRKIAEELLVKVIEDNYMQEKLEKHYEEKLKDYFEYDAQMSERSD